jgi:antitoxin component YwqK of YwqJK toxin-antitoxin module
MYYKIHYFIYLLLIGIVASCTPGYQLEEEQLISINLIDREGLSETISNKERLKRYENVDFLCSQPYQKVLRVYGRTAKGCINAYVTSYHPNGQLQQYLEISNGRAFGTFQEWYANGELKVETNVIGGEADITMGAKKTWLFDGKCRAWNEQGCLEAEFFYQRGVQEGVSLYYHPNGQIWKSVPFVNNKIQGTYNIYLEDGFLLLTSEYDEGFQNGLSVRYWGPDQIATTEEYCKGLLTQGKYYDLTGALIAEVNDGHGFRAVFSKTGIAELQEFRYGALEGEVRSLDFKGRIARVYHIKEGLKQGEEIEYYNRQDKLGQQIPKISINWFDNKIQGSVKTWYENGIQESQREMSNNMKNGLATGWYRDGNLMIIEEYDRDKLVRGEYYKKGEKIPLSILSDGKGVATLYDGDGNFLRKVNYLNSTPLD